MSGAYLPILLRVQLQQTYGYRAVVLPAIIVKILELEFAYVSVILLGAPIILELEFAHISDVLLRAPTTSTTSTTTTAPIILELESVRVSDILLGAPIILELESARIAAMIPNR